MRANNNVVTQLIKSNLFADKNNNEPSIYLDVIRI